MRMVGQAEAHSADKNTANNTNSAQRVVVVGDGDEGDEVDSFWPLAAWKHKILGGKAKRKVRAMKSDMGETGEKNTKIQKKSNTISKKKNGTFNDVFEPAKMSIVLGYIGHLTIKLRASTRPNDLQPPTTQRRTFSHRHHVAQ